MNFTGSICGEDAATLGCQDDAKAQSQPTVITADAHLTNPLTVLAAHLIGAVSGHSVSRTLLADPEVTAGPEAVSLNSKRRLVLSIQCLAFRRSQEIGLAVGVG